MSVEDFSFDPSDLEALEQRLSRAQVRHEATGNPVTRFFSGLALRAAAADLSDSQEHAGLALQLAALHDGRPPFVED